VVARAESHQRLASDNGPSANAARRACWRRVPRATREGPPRGGAVLRVHGVLRSRRSGRTETVAERVTEEGLGPLDWRQPEGLVVDRHDVGGDVSGALATLPPANARCATRRASTARTVRNGWRRRPRRGSGRERASSAGLCLHVPLVPRRRRQLGARGGPAAGAVRMAAGGRASRERRARQATPRSAAS